jgi:menaquinone-9 beta-reductase
MLDVIVAGAGPAGSIAALVLARAGARVLIIDREAFPRDKLCGDTVNPGAIALLASLGICRGPLEGARPLYGMILSGPTMSLRAEYGSGIAARAIRRYDLDAWLLECSRAGWSCVSRSSRRAAPGASCVDWFWLRAGGLPRPYEFLPRS